MDILFQRNENLIGVYRLDEIVGNLTPDSLVHDVFFLAFRNHHNRCCRLNVLYSLQSFKTGQARHHLIEQDKIESFLTTKLNSIYAIATHNNFPLLIVKNHLNHNTRRPNRAV